MPRRFLTLLVAAWAALAGIHAADAADPVFPRGSRIGLVPAGDLTLSGKFPGFEDAKRGVSVNILELSGPTYDALQQSAFAAATQGSTIDKRELFTFAGGVGYLISGHGDDNGTPVRTWYLIASSATTAVGRIAMLVRVKAPEAALTAYPDKSVRAMLETVSFRMPPPEELLAMLPFKVGELAGFRPLKVDPGGLAILIDGPGDDISKQPYIIVSVGSASPADLDDRGRFAREVLRAAPLRDLRITSAEAMRIGGAQGYEIRADAKGPTETQLALVQWLRFGTGGFIRVIGIGPKDRWDELFPRFRRVRDGVELR